MLQPLAVYAHFVTNAMQPSPAKLVVETIWSNISKCINQNKPRNVTEAFITCISVSFFYEFVFGLQRLGAWLGEISKLENNFARAQTYWTSQYVFEQALLAPVVYRSINEIEARACRWASPNSMVCFLLKVEPLVILRFRVAILRHECWTHVHFLLHYKLSANLSACCGEAHYPGSSRSSARI